MAKHFGKCRKCGKHLEFDPDSGEPVVCPHCGALLPIDKDHDQPAQDQPDPLIGMTLGEFQQPAQDQAEPDSQPVPEPAPAQADPLIGMTLGEFEITELLGRGGMGGVYKARQPSLDRIVAIKVLPRAPSEKLAARFEREARAVAAVNHPNIINVYSVGSDQGYQYIAMEFVAGETLREILEREGPLSPERAIEMMKQTASALVAAHGAGILHRDIKPANILLTPRGDVKVADFGLAKRPDIDVSVTQAGKPLGTPLYMPPEVARGGQFEVASDLYSLGATFYHLLAGRPPFEGDTRTEIAVKQVESSPPPLTETAPHVPQALVWAIDRLLARNPAERFPTAEALLENLEYIDAGMAASQSASTVDRLIPAPKRRVLDKIPVAKKAERPQFLIAGIVVGVLVVAVALILIFTLGPKDNGTSQKGGPPPVKPEPPPDAEKQIDLGKGVTMKLALIPAGEFMMGSPESEKDRNVGEGPQHKVTISSGAPGFYMGVTEVTQEQYEAVMGKNPSKFKGPKNPVNQVSWNDAAEFCKKLSAKTRGIVRLPTEAEWEYACRAGTKTRFYFGDSEKQLGDYAWYKENSDKKVHPVAQKEPNAWGLYDMHGNAWEWCSDWHGSYANAKAVDPQGPASGKDRVLRGGSWGDDAVSCRAARRLGRAPDDQDKTRGVRVVVGFGSGAD